MDKDGVPVTISGCVRAKQEPVPPRPPAHLPSALAVKRYGLTRRPLPLRARRSVFVKYNSVSGDAFISEYGGQYRGVRGAALRGLA